MPREFVPMPVDGRFDLDRLRRLAAEFDQISDEEGGLRYRAVEFVEWIDAEVGCGRHNLSNAYAANAASATPAHVRRWNERQRAAGRRR